MYQLQGTNRCQESWSPGMLGAALCPVRQRRSGQSGAAGFRSFSKLGPACQTHGSRPRHSGAPDEGTSRPSVSFPRARSRPPPPCVPAFSAHLFSDRASGFETLLLNVCPGENVRLMNNAAHRDWGLAGSSVRRLQVTTNGPWANPTLPLAALRNWAGPSEP